MSLLEDISTPRVSLEYFPPKSFSAERALMTGAHVLRRFSPEFQTVTFGADGSAIDGSLDWPVRLQNLNEIPTAAHITLCQFPTQDDFLAHAETLWGQGIERLVVLRGDCITGEGLGGFQSVADAIRALRSRHDFDISVAAYPEIHPKAGDLLADIEILLEKQAAGANRAITQFFFRNEDFYSFRDRVERAGFYKEIVPGILPIGNFEKVRGFAEKCGAKVPNSFAARFARCGNDKAAQTEVSREIVCEQVADLARNGVDAIHIYTLNRVDLTADAIRAFSDELSRIGSGRPKLALVG